MKVFRLLVRAVFALTLTAGAALADFQTTSNPVHPGGTRAAVDLPADQHIRNIGSKVDGYGLCVGTSQETAGRWQTVPELGGFQKWLANRSGGSTPNQLARDLPLFFASKGVTAPKYLQHEGGDIELLRKAVKTRRMAAITYAGHDPFYGSNTGIAHMVNLAHLDGKLGAVIDNNQPGAWRWMDDTQLVNRWLGKQDNGRPIMVTDGRRWFEVGGGWVVVWLGAPPPPIDTTAKDYFPDLPQIAPDETGSDPGGPMPDPVMPDPFDLPRQVSKFKDGINVKQFKPRMRYWVNGVETDRLSAFKVMDDGGLQDDSGKAFVSFVGDAVTTKRAVEALKPYSDKLHIGVFSEDSWVSKTRLKHRVTAQLPASNGGKTVFTSDDLTAETAVKAAKAALGIVDPPATPPETPKMPEPVAPGPVTPAPAPNEPTPTPTKIPLWLIAVIGYILYRLSQRSN